MGALATVVAMLFLIGVFWGFGLFSRLGTTWFSAQSEDLVKDIYTTSYHAAYDENPTWCSAMNYPYGEYHTFSGLHPLVAMPLQALRKTGVCNAWQATLPLLNIGILLSIVLCALFLYLLLYELNLPWWYAALAALLITLLSPQLQRIGGHLTLSYYCAIPMLLYFSLRHLRSKHWTWALLIGLAALVFGLCHPYYLVFYIVVSTCELGYLFIRREKEGIKTGVLITTTLLQLLLPMALFYLCTNIGMVDGNRTAIPSGFFKYSGRIAGLLFPYGRDYFIKDSAIFPPVNWESRSYIGATAVVVLAVLVARFVIGLLNRKHRKWLSPTGNQELDLMLIAATILVIYACGVPFAMLPPVTLNYIGPLAQIRASGRLVWLFYYVIGIVAFYMIFQWSKGMRGHWRTILLVIVMLVSSAEAIAYNHHNKAWYNDSWTEWTDYNNNLPANQWVKEFDASSYQAILTLPIFNVGGEFIYLPSQQSMFQRSALLSMKTGLPLVCNESSRSDINQAWDCIALSRTAWQPLELADALPDSRPLLLAVAPDTSALSSTEKNLIEYAEHLFDINGATLYSLPISALTRLREATQRSLFSDYTAALENNTHYVLKEEVITADIRKHTLIFETTEVLDGELEFSFWMSNILVDLMSRSMLEVKAYVDGSSQTLYNWSIEPLIDIVDRNTGDGLIRFRFTPPEGCERLVAEIHNPYMKHTDICYRNFLLRKTTNDIAWGSTSGYINNIPVLFNPKYVAIEGNQFVIDGNPWFPIMLNYAASLNGDRVVPASWYTGDNMREHFDTIASWGFNAVRVCLIIHDNDGDTAAMFRATRRMVQQADSAGLHVMLLLTRPPLEDYWRDYAVGLMRCLADLPALWAYDLMNEPLYFDPEPKRDKTDAIGIVRDWRQLVCRNAPHQLFTVATAEPIEVFEWDPSMLPVDFVEMHTYHPLRVQSEIWWYSHYCGKPWMIGETGLPADDDSISYSEQKRFMAETYAYAIQQGACGYGWWEFQDCPNGVNFEAQYTGLRDVNGRRKPATTLLKQFSTSCTGTREADSLPPVNYYNMLAYSNLAVCGTVVDEFGKPIDGAVVRGWNEDWSVGINTYTNREGRFRLVSNDCCTHFEISAPHHSRAKFNRRLSHPQSIDLPHRNREYQQIPLLGWGDNTHILPVDYKQFEAPTAVEASIGTVTLKRL